MRRGTIYWINLEPSSPREFGKTRPGLIISNSVQNFALDTVVALPLSSRRPEIWPLRLKLKIRLQKGNDSFVVLPGIRQVSKARLLDVVGFLGSQEMNRIAEALEAYLSD
jgi:mRNA-degrading endonuclease toxin of MazEF toxin-antitoxin module